MTLEPLKILFGAFGTAKHKNALHAPLWFCALVSIPCFYLAARADGRLAFAFFSVGCIPVLQFVVAYNVLLFKDRDRLHSEEYRLRNRAFEIAESKGGDIKISPVNLHDIANPFPETKKLSGPAKRGE